MECDPSLLLHHLDISSLSYYVIVFNFIISYSGGIKDWTFPLNSTLWFLSLSVCLSFLLCNFLLSCHSRLQVPPEANYSDLFNNTWQRGGKDFLAQQGLWSRPSARQEKIWVSQGAQIIRSDTDAVVIFKGSQNWSTHLNIRLIY